MFFRREVTDFGQDKQTVEFGSLEMHSSLQIRKQAARAKLCKLRQGLAPPASCISPGRHAFLVDKLLSQNS